jgi:hypothetical protein
MSRKKIIVLMVKVKNYLNLKVKLLGEILKYDLYYSLIYHLK